MLVGLISFILFFLVINFTMKNFEVGTNMLYLNKKDLDIILTELEKTEEDKFIL